MCHCLWCLFYHEVLALDRIVSRRFLATTTQLCQLTERTHKNYVSSAPVETEKAYCASVFRPRFISLSAKKSKKQFWGMRKLADLGRFANYRTNPGALVLAIYSAGNWWNSRIQGLFKIGNIFGKLL